MEITDRHYKKIPRKTPTKVIHPNDNNRKLVARLAAMGSRQEDIALLLDICVDTLVKHYSAEVRKGNLESTAKVAQTLYEKAISGDTTCMIFWLKTRGGWRETDRLDVNVKGEITKQFVFRIHKPGEDFPAIDAEE
jgi:ribosomal protein S20